LQNYRYFVIFSYDQMENVLEQQLLAATELIEKQVDAELEQLEKLDEDDLEALRLRRLQAMKSAEKRKQDWLSLGHGKYEELADESEFFAASKKSKNLVCHFYRDSTPTCKIVDKHLAALASKHVEARFVRINAERCHFLVERLRIKVMPTICLARDGKTVDYVVGLDDVGGREDFPMEMLEWRIAQSGVIEYSGDLLQPPVSMTGSTGLKGLSGILAGKSKQKTIRGRDDDDSDDDY